MPVTGLSSFFHSTAPPLCTTVKQSMPADRLQRGREGGREGGRERRERERERKRERERERERKRGRERREIDR